MFSKPTRNLTYIIITIYLYIYESWCNRKPFTINFDVSIVFLVKENGFRIDNFAITGPQVLFNDFPISQNEAIVELDYFIPHSALNNR